jgi:histidinol dehydrogenase|tara:strand:- start:405 stop:1679 length:1275 start_codon:yes stop_codon:yes gene_type:complete
MIKVINCNNSNFTKKLTILLEKRRQVKRYDTKIVSSIINDIKKNKIKALLKYEKKFSKNKNIKPSKIQINTAIKKLDPKVKKAIDFAYDRILKFHSIQLKNLKNIIYKDKFKNKLEYRNVPIESVGIYVPGNLPSTLLMISIPAKLAKVKRLVLATPKINGNLNPAVLYVAKKVGIKEIYSFGGAQAIASLAYIQKVNKVLGPGNRFVAEAKRQLSGKVIGTESMFAGPSEICVLADKDSNIDQVATSLISQAEHDTDSQCILITKDERLIKKVKIKIAKLLESLPRKKIASSSLKKHGLILKVKNDRQIIDCINTISTEHLELLVKNYKKYSKKIINVGSICNGEYSPMCVSDFTVGINHVLPTAGSAKFSSGLNINEFIKKISVVTLSKLGVEKIADPAITLSEFEQLDGHAQSIRSRIKRG